MPVSSDIIDKRSECMLYEQSDPDLFCPQEIYKYTRSAVEINSIFIPFDVPARWYDTVEVFYKSGIFVAYYTGSKEIDWYITVLQQYVILQRQYPFIVYEVQKYKKMPCIIFQHYLFKKNDLRGEIQIFMVLKIWEKKKIKVWTKQVESLDITCKKEGKSKEKNCFLHGFLGLSTLKLTSIPMPCFIDSQE